MTFILIPPHSSLAAAEFAERWKGRGYERGESQPFWIDLLSHVYGIETPSDGFITFEDHRMVDAKSKKTKMNNKKNKGGRNPKLDPAINRYSVNYSSEEDMRFLKMFERSGMTSKSAFIKARIFDEPFHVVTFDKSQHEYYAKLSDFHAQFRMVGNRSVFGRFACKELQPNIEGTEEPLFRAQNRCIGVQVRKVHDAVSADYV